jgi:hypothetical protein
MNNNQFPSKYSNGKTVSAAQYITELICEKKAKLSKEDLHARFWLSKKWSAYYRNQIATANKLVKKYDARAIVRALNSSKAAKIYSLRAPHLLSIIEQEDQKLQTENKEISRPLDRSDKNTYRQIRNTSNSLLSKLKDIDDGT